MPQRENIDAFEVKTLIGGYKHVTADLFTWLVVCVTCQCVVFHVMGRILIS